jgi:hypothetical protein
MRSRLSSSRDLYLCGCVTILMATGCYKPSPPTAEGAVTGGAEVTAEEATPRETLDKKTQNVLDLKEALASGGELASKEVSSTNPLLQSADVYRTSVAKIGGMAVQQAIQIRNAQSINNPKPLSHTEFMREIIKPGQPDGIMLAMLPYYQEYAWDEANQELVVVSFPARVEEREKRR